jgi:hypothetical protein
LPLFFYITTVSIISPHTFNHMAHTSCWALGALLLLGFGCHQAPPAEEESGSAPPESLVQENWQKAGAVVQGKLLSVEDNISSSTQMLAEKVYKGPFKAGDTIRYYEFRPEGYDSARIGRPLVVFLTSKQEDDGRITWGTATDLAEFPYTPALEKLLHSTQL